MPLIGGKYKRLNKKNYSTLNQQKIDNPIFTCKCIINNTYTRPPIYAGTRPETCTKPPLDAENLYSVPPYRSTWMSNEKIKFNNLGDKSHELRAD